MKIFLFIFFNVKCSQQDSPDSLSMDADKELGVETFNQIHFDPMSLDSKNPMNLYRQNCTDLEKCGNLDEKQDEEQLEIFKKFYNDTYKDVLFCKSLDLLMHQIFYVGVFNYDFRESAKIAFSELLKLNNNDDNPRIRNIKIKMFKKTYSDLLSKYQEKLKVGIKEKLVAAINKSRENLLLPENK